MQYIKHTDEDMPKSYGNLKVTDKTWTSPSAMYAFEVSGDKLRILRIVNGNRTHDIIIDDFQDNEVIIENSSSNFGRLRFDSKDGLVHFLLTLQRTNKFYDAYARTRGDYYIPAVELTAEQLHNKLGR